MMSRSLPAQFRQCLAFLLLLTLLTQWPVTVWAQSVPAQASVDIPCAETPFGHVLKLGQENEVFLGINNALAEDPGRLHPYQLDRNPSTGHLQEQFFADFATEPSHIRALAGVAADLDGDGKSEFVQGFTDAIGQYTVLVRKNGGTPQSHIENWPNQTNRAMAAGDIFGLDNGSQAVVIASRSSDGGITVAVFADAGNGAVGTPNALWRSNINNRSGATMMHVALGNLDNDPYADIVVSLLQSDQKTAQLIDLEYQPNYQAGSGANFAQNLQERATTTYDVRASGDTGPVGPQDLQVTLANLTGSGQDKVVLAWDQSGSPGRLSPALTLRAFDLKDDSGTTKLIQAEQWKMQTNSIDFALAAGDLDGDGRSELVVGYNPNGNSSFGHLDIVVLDLINIHTPTPMFNELARWQDSEQGRYSTRYLALAVGDLDRDNQAEIVAAFQDANLFGYQTLYLKMERKTHHLQLADSGRHDSTVDGPISLSLGDWNNDSIRAFVQGKCARVVDANVTAVNFVPPYWQKIQGDQDKGGSLGQSISQQDTVERSLTYNRSDTVSAYLGAVVGASFFDLIEFSASAKATGARENAMSDRKTTSTGTYTTTTVGRSWQDDALVYAPADYKCFSYQLTTNNNFIPTEEARLRFCQYQPLQNAKPPLQASELDSWDDSYGDKPEFAPVIRDWSSLALFRGAFATQSSNQATARLAVDSEIVHGSFISGTVAQTNNENHAWWQVDLGAVQRIGKIRLWTPQGSLSNFYLLVANTDFATMPGQADPVNLINQPGVQQYTLADLGNGFAMTDTAPMTATFLTLDNQKNPIQGRYIRVQRAGVGALALAEVQIFGTNHVDPDRYPLDLCDESTPKDPQKPWCDITKNDGYFKVRLYNPWHTSDADTYMTVKTRGHLLWDGRANSALNGLTVERGNTTIDWSMSQGAVASKVAAHEISNSTSVGAEFEVEGGVGIRVQAGGGREHTVGMAEEVALSTEWGNELNMGGHVQGFPPEYNQPWAVNCHYRFQPYYYELTETSNLGYQHSFPVLDYLIPYQSDSIDLNRTQAQMLAACRNGNLPAPTAQANHDVVVATINQPVTVNVLANDEGNELAIKAVGAAHHGAVTYTQRTITYTPTLDFQGVDSFTYTVESSLLAARDVNEFTTGVVTVTVGTMPVSGANALYLPLIQR